MNRKILVMLEKILRITNKRMKTEHISGFNLRVKFCKNLLMLTALSINLDIAVYDMNVA